MTVVDRVWCAALTKDASDAGTSRRSTTHVFSSNVPIGLLVNEDGHDKLYNMTRPAFNGDGLKRGHALINAFTRTSNGVDLVGFSIDTDRLTHSSTRIFNLSTDLWRPESVFVWGDRGGGNEVAPIAMNLSLNAVLSSEEGFSSTALHRIGAGHSETVIERILVLTLTDGGNAGTNGEVTLRITGGGGTRVVDFELPQTPQQDLEADRANFYAAVPDSPFKVSDLQDESIRLSIDRDDLWVPQSVFVFGVGDADPSNGAFTSAVPILYLPQWSGPGLSTSSAGANARSFSPFDVPPPPEENPAPEQGPLAPV